MAGEEDPEEPGSLASRPRPLRLIVLSAGSFSNFIFAILLFSASFMIPHEVSVGRAVINQVLPDSPAAAAGLQTGDVIYKINGRDVQNVNDASYNIRLYQGETMTMKVKRGSEFLDLRVELALGAAFRDRARRESSSVRSTRLRKRSRTRRGVPCDWARVRLSTR